MADILLASYCVLRLLKREDACPRQSSSLSDACLRDKYWKNWKRMACSFEKWHQALLTWMTGQGLDIPYSLHLSQVRHQSAGQAVEADIPVPGAVALRLYDSNFISPVSILLGSWTWAMTKQLCLFLVGNALFSADTFIKVFFWDFSIVWAFCSPAQYMEF